MPPLIALINHVLQQQGWARDRLRPYAGRAVLVQAVPLEIQLLIREDGLVDPQPFMPLPENGSHQRPSPDVTLRLSLAVLPLFSVDPGRAMREVRIEGDAELAQLLGRLAREVRWDVEEDASRLVGDVAAHRLASMARNLIGYARDAAARSAEMGAAYLVDEEPTLVRKEELERFSVAVAVLRDDCERLTKRIEVLANARTHAQSDAKPGVLVRNGVGHGNEFG